LVRLSGGMPRLREEIGKAGEGIGKDEGGDWQG
jgi:hypothetical protein